MMRRLLQARLLRRSSPPVDEQLQRLRARIDTLEHEVQENRRLHRRIAELTDIVQELLVPATQRDEKRMRELLDRYADRL